MALSAENRCVAGHLPHRLTSVFHSVLQDPGGLRFWLHHSPSDAMCLHCGPDDLDHSSLLPESLHTRPSASILKPEYSRFEGHI